MHSTISVVLEDFSDRRNHTLLRAGGLMANHSGSSSKSSDTPSPFTAGI